MTNTLNGLFEGLEKMIRGGNEWKSIKIPQRNLAYITNSIRHVSLLTRSRPHSYRETIGPQNRVMQTKNTAEDDTQCNQSHMQNYGKQNRTNKAIQNLTHISPNTLGTYSIKYHKSTTNTRKPECLIRRLTSSV
jgi:hypothetical protein